MTTTSRGPVILALSAAEWVYLLDQLQPSEWLDGPATPAEGRSLKRKLLSVEQMRRQRDEVA